MNIFKRHFGVTAHQLPFHMEVCSLFSSVAFSVSYVRVGLVISIALFFLAVSSPAADGTWSNAGATSANWTEATNWSVVPGATVPITGTNADASVATFNSAVGTYGTIGNPILINSASENIRSITFDTSAGNYYIGTTGGNPIYLSSGGTIQIAATTTANAVETISAPLVVQGAGGTYTFANNKVNAASSLVLGGAISGGNAGTTVLTFSGSTTPTMNYANGVISNGSATDLNVVVGGGNWTYAGANTYTGTTSFNASGTISVSSFNSVSTNAGLGTVHSASSSLGAPTTVANGTIDFAGGNTVTEKIIYTGTGEITDRAIRLSSGGAGTTITLDQSGTGLLKFISTVSGNGANGSKILTLQGSTSGTGEISGTITNTAGVGNILITKAGTGTWTLSGANTYAGATTISAGTLLFAKTASLYGSNTLNWTAANIKIASGGTLALNVGGTNEFDTGNVTTLLTNLGGANGSATTGFASGSKIAFDTTNASGGTFTVADNIADSSGAGGGAIGLTKLGTGTLVLTGTNTNTGATTVSGGTLTLNSAGVALSGTSGLTINSGATVQLGAANQIKDTATLTLNGGTLNFNGKNETMGTLTLSSSSALTFGTGTENIIFANSSALAGVWSGTLSINGFTFGTDTLNFSAAGGLVASQLSKLSFVDYGNAGGQIDGSGNVTPLLSYSGSTDIVISSAITGTTTVTQSGTGSTTLTGTNTSSGNATVTQGTLVIGTVAGGNWVGNVTVSGTGILKGRGTITGDVVVNAGGNYSPGNSPAIQNVGSLTVNAGGFTTIELDGATAGTGAGFHDKVVSAGAVTLNGGTLNASAIFSGSTGYVPVLGSKHTVITGSTITGKFTGYNYSSNPEGIAYMPEYTPTEINLFAVPANYGTDIANLNYNQKQIGFALQSFRPSEIDNRSALDDKGKIFNGLMRMDASNLKQAFDQLSPEKLTVMSTSTFQSASMLDAAVLQRSSELRWSEPGVSVNGVAMTDRKGEMVNEPIAGMGKNFYIVRAQPRTPLGYFANVGGNFSDVDPSSERIGYRSKTESASFGVDYALNANHSVGLFGGQFYSDSDLGGGGGSVINNTGRFGLFHDYHRGGFYVNTSASAGFSSYDTKRKIQFLSEKATGDSDGASIGLQIAGGYDYQWNEYHFGPTASVGYDHAWINSFSEKDSAAKLNIAEQNADSVVSNIGFRINRPLQWNNLIWIPEWRCGFRRQWIETNPIRAQFQAGGDAFKVKPENGGLESATTGVGVAVILGEGLSVRLNYDAILNDQSSEHMVNIGFSAGF